jgi:AcrR family transcriptional regulator
MTTRTSTPDKILEASRRLFNSKGYAATSLSEIAAAIGISQGNLTYHFPAKSDLAARIDAEARQRLRERRTTRQPGRVADDYVAHLLFAMDLTWSNRFLQRDRMHFIDKVPSPDADLKADFEELYGLMERMSGESMFRADAVADLQTLTRSIWVMSRYWMDYLRDFEGLTEISWADQERGIEHHFALLLPCLTAPAQQELRVALVRTRKRSEQRQTG